MAATKSINMAPEDLLHQIRAIRRALLIGLDSYGEIERLTDEIGKQELSGQTIAGEIRPIHPTGCNDTVGEFATALRFLETMESELGNA